jgi:hypothetical protein
VRRLVPRRPLLIVFLVAAVVVAACSGDSDPKKAKAKPNDTAAAATTATAAAATTTTAPDPAACLRGTYRFTRMDYDGPVQTAFGPTTIVGGIAGRRIELKPDNTFRFTDDGREPVQFALQSPGGAIPGTAVLKAQADGTYAPTATTSTFDITALQGTLTITFYEGTTTNIPLPPDGAGVKETFGINGEAIYTCDRNTVTVRFPALTIGLERV